MALRYVAPTHWRIAVHVQDIWIEAAPALVIAHGTRLLQNLLQIISSRSSTAGAASPHAPTTPTPSTTLTSTPTREPTNAHTPAHTPITPTGVSRHIAAFMRRGQPTKVNAESAKNKSGSRVSPGGQRLLNVSLGTGLSTLRARMGVLRRLHRLLELILGRSPGTNAARGCVAAAPVAVPGTGSDALASGADVGSVEPGVHTALWRQRRQPLSLRTAVDDVVAETVSSFLSPAMFREFAERDLLPVLVQCWLEHNPSQVRHARLEYEMV